MYVCVCMYYNIFISDFALFHPLDFRPVAEVTLLQKETREFLSILDRINLDYSLRFSEPHDNS